MNKHEGEPRPPPEGSSHIVTIRVTSPTSLEISIRHEQPDQNHQDGSPYNEPASNIEGVAKTLERLIGLIPEDTKTIEQFLSKLEESLGKGNEVKGKTLKDRTDWISGEVEQLQLELKNPDADTVVEATLEFLGKNMDTLPPNNRQELILLLKERFGNDTIADL